MMFLTEHHAPGSSPGVQRKIARDDAGASQKIAAEPRTDAGTDVLRTDNGAINTEHYLGKAHRLRKRYFARLLFRFIQFWRRRTILRELDALDARDLHDIGISRCEIDAIASGAYAADTSRKQRGQ